LSPSHLGGFSGKWVYGGSWERALAIAVGLSWGMMNVIAVVFERRTLLNPRGQFLAFYWGDLLCLPGLVLVIWYLGRRMPKEPNWTDRPKWHRLCLAIGVLIGIGMHLLDGHSGQFKGS
jgi:hypothetical protein